MKKLIFVIFFDVRGLKWLQMGPWGLEKKLQILKGQALSFSNDIYHVLIWKSWFLVIFLWKGVLLHIPFRLQFQSEAARSFYIYSPPQIDIQRPYMSLRAIFGEKMGKNWENPPIWPQKVSCFPLPPKLPVTPILGAKAPPGHVWLSH